METVSRTYAKRPPEDRFWEKTIASPCRYEELEECLIWTGGVDKNGYGLFQVESRRTIRAHRWAFESAHPGVHAPYVLHACDTPGCVNPAHLSAGTARANAHDRDSRGRGASGQRHYAAKLTDAQTAELRARAEAGEYPPTLAAEYGISRSHAYNLIAGRKRA